MASTADGYCFESSDETELAAEAGSLFDQFNLDMLDTKEIA